MKSVIAGRWNDKAWRDCATLVKQEMIKSISTETLLQELKDRGVIRS